MTMNEPTDQQIEELTARLASGNLTPTQLNFITNQWGISDEDFLRRAKRIILRNSIKVFLNCLISVGLIWIFCRLILK